MTDTNPITDLKSRLTEQQYEVTQHKGTEAPFSGKYVDYKDDGVYQCVCCGAELFSSDHKYDSKSGWPSFWLPLAGDKVRIVKDQSHGMVREEVVCAGCDAHLGHIFEDGRSLAACAIASTLRHSNSIIQSDENNHS